MREKTVQEFLKHSTLLSCNPHGLSFLQTIIDTLAYAENIPIRLLNIEKLENFPETIKSTLAKKEGFFRQLLIKELPKIENSLDEIWQNLSDEKILLQAYQELKSCMDNSQEVGNSIPLGELWWKAILTILQHIEANFWVTLMGNPLPAHALCRLQSEWSLYILLWCWQERKRFSEILNNDGLIPEIFGFKGLIGFTLSKKIEIECKDEDGNSVNLIPIVGPVFEVNSNNPHQEYEEKFFSFCRNLVKKINVKHELHIIPFRSELSDALSSRIDHTLDELKLRCCNIVNSLRNLLRVKTSLLLDNFSRNDWEDVVIFFTWYARWQQTLSKGLERGGFEEVYCSSEMCELSLKISKVKEKTNYSFEVVKRDQAARKNDYKEIEKLCSEIEFAILQGQAKKSAKGKNYVHGRDKEDSIYSQDRQPFEQRIERFDIFYNRVRERQNAAWSRQILAINSLLLRHGVRSSGFVNPGRTVNDENVGKYLLKGFGRYISRYLANISRADFSDIYWLDWSKSPAQLIHATGYSGVLEYRALIDQIQGKFFDWARADSADPQKMKNCQAFKGEESDSQAYRIVATKIREIYPSLDGKSKKPYFDCYEMPDDGNQIRPQSTIGLPIIINNRVFGVILLGGMAKKQFYERLFPPLYNAANIIGATMYQQCLQLEHRKIIEFFLNKSVPDPIASVGKKDYDQFKEVSESLSNIFLCEVSQIWILDEHKTNNSDDGKLHFCLKGFNWYKTFLTNPENAYGMTEQCFQHKPAKNDFEQDSKETPFAGLAINLVALENDPSSAGDQLKGRFVHGVYFHDKGGVDKYSANCASDAPVELGTHFLPTQIEDSAPDHIKRRKKIYIDYGFNSIMAFPLIEPAITSDDGSCAFPGRVIAVITLHSKAAKQANPDNPSNYSSEQDWSDGWQPMVAYMQDTLTYLIQHYLAMNKRTLYLPDEDWNL